ncbi:MAG: hypothetical protein H5T42_02295 [Methanothrix sp.]|jgi:hypothetical protein|uniref:Uncharacterized protein n=1 Tax=Methanothrix thermoacetophila (strain DSM 6194 / JCM 14653 / NBRC 101360 / PT) TaxID=349307 RepID=A0B8U9_METTP|nr:MULTISPECIES: hypothetical protein [Methanothrix]ABK15123.1 hypothetical protein Mthe_1348 [Methanothrix thermoacetophila PT]MBC7079293.1 hypothetical protein [Methanothrix sp.]NPU86757.1 hypothetical protein [Methanothrix sp.]
MEDISDRIAALAARALEPIISAMDAVEISCEMEADGRRWMLEASDAHIFCRMGIADCLELLERSAEELGVPLEEELVVRHPEMEFGENMVTGFFEAWRGVAVRRRNPMEDILDALISELEMRGVSISLDEDFLLLSKRRSMR